MRKNTELKDGYIDHKKEILFSEIRDAALNPSNGLSLYQIANLVMANGKEDFYKKLIQYVKENTAKEEI